MKYKVGDRVEISKSFSGILLKGDKGTIKCIETICGTAQILVVWDKYLAECFVENGHGHYITEEYIKLIEPATLTTSPIKAYELMKLAAENPEKYEGKRYKVCGIYCIDHRGNKYAEAIFHNGILEGEGCNNWLFVNSNTILEEIPPEPKPVSFREATQSGKKIKPSEDGWSFDDVDFWFRQLCCKNNNLGDNFEKYVNGQWFIKED